MKKSILLTIVFVLLIAPSASAFQYSDYHGIWELKGCIETNFGTKEIEPIIIHIGPEEYDGYYSGWSDAVLKASWNVLLDFLRSAYTDININERLKGLPFIPHIWMHSDAWGYNFSYTIPDIRGIYKPFDISGYVLHEWQKLIPVIQDPNDKQLMFHVALVKTIGIADTMNAFFRIKPQDNYKIWAVDGHLPISETELSKSSNIFLTLTKIEE